MGGVMWKLAVWHRKATKKKTYEISKVYLNKMFITKAELQHTDAKVGNLHVSDGEKRWVTLKVRNLERMFRLKFTECQESVTLLGTGRWDEWGIQVECRRESWGCLGRRGRTPRMRME
jgi:hypothetical protein